MTASTAISTLPSATLAQASLSAADVELAGEERVDVGLRKEARIPRQAVLEAAEREAVARGLLLV